MHISVCLIVAVEGLKDCICTSDLNNIKSNINYIVDVNIQCIHILFALLGILTGIGACSIDNLTRFVQLKAPF